MARVILTPRAVADLHELMDALGLPESTPRRLQRSLRVLERFPLAGRALTGRWEPVRFLIGPWPWMMALYLFDEAEDIVYVVGVHDGRSSTAATQA